MTRPAFDLAVQEAKRFLRVAKDVEWDKTDAYPIPGKTVAACKRASLDLTRALAEMRKP
jgi:hypothetical protein